MLNFTKQKQKTLTPLVARVRFIVTGSCEQNLCTLSNYYPLRRAWQFIDLKFLNNNEFR